MKPYGGKGDYQMIGLWTAEGKQIFDYVHRIVAKAYVPNPNNYPEVNHKDEVKDHNWASNIEWCTRSYNLSYGTRMERMKNSLTNHRINHWRAVYCEELDKTFRSTSEAARELGVNQPNVSLCCRGYLKTTGGYHLRYADN